MAVKRGIDKAVDAITRELEKMSKPVTRSMIAQVGTISANHDETIGQSSPKPWRKLARTASSPSKKRGIETSLDIVKGMQFDRGYLSPYFITDPERMEVVLEIRSFSSTKSDQRDERPSAAPGAGRARAFLLIVAEDIEGEALATLVVNKLRGTLQAPR